MRIPSGEVPFTISKAITFREDGKDLPVYALIVRQKEEDYDDSELSSISIRKMKEPKISDDEIASKNASTARWWWNLEKRERSDIVSVVIQSISQHSNRQRQPFIVADILRNDVHVLSG